MKGKTDCHKDYYLVRHNIGGLGELVVSHSSFDNPVLVLDDIDGSYYWLSTYEIEYVEHLGVWSNDHNLCGGSAVIDCETTEMIELEKFDEDHDLPSGFRSIYG